MDGRKPEIPTANPYPSLAKELDVLTPAVS